ncbi:MAG: tetratricopeptide repeat-containing sulfotransferase family protein [Acuticoccus sp.]
MHQTLAPDRALTRARSLVKRGDHSGARALLSDVAQRHPRNKRLRKALTALGIPPGAPRSPRVAAEVRALGALVEAHRHEEAMRLAAALLEVLPGDPVVLTLLGAALIDKRHYQEAQDCFEQVIRAAPTFVRGWTGFGTALGKRERHHQAVQALHQALALSPLDIDALSALGASLRNLNRHEEALDCFRRIIAMEDGFKVRLNTGTTLLELGRAEEARTELERALHAKPDYCMAHRALSMVTRYSPDTPHLEAMNALAADGTLDEDARIHLAFARAKAFDDAGDRANAFAAWREGNALRQRQIGYNAEAERTRFGTITRLFRDHTLTPLTFDPIPYRPIFVVGMPRSGTSLCEQILDRHPAVWGAGELEDMHRAVARAAEANGRRLCHDMVKDIRAYYLNVLRDIGAPHGVVVDKMPQNFRFVGFIRLAFPEARIVHMRRDPAAVCFSLWKSYFSIDSHGYAYGLEDSADYYKLYHDIMAMFEERYADSIFRLDYEALTDEPERHIRALLDACGLPFDPACLEAHRSTRAVRTVSALQVRQAIYKGSSDAWRRYEAHLAPLLTRLAEHGLAPPAADASGGV